MAKRSVVQQTFRVSNKLNSSQREVAAGLIIQEIFDRTQRGVDKNGKPFKSYTEQYVNSLDFKNTGKSRGDVNLTLTGDMLGGLQLISHSPGLITIGYPETSSFTANKAEGNITGSYGKTPNRDNARDFLGLPKTVLERISKRVLADSSVDNERASTELLGALLDGLLTTTGGDDG